MTAPERGGWLRSRPWIWVVLLFLLVLAVNVIFVWIAGREPPQPVE